VGSGTLQSMSPWGPNGPDDAEMPLPVCTDSVAKLSLRRLAIRDALAVEGRQRERRMMGRREDGQGQFFYSFDLDRVVPTHHLVRQIDGLLDLGWVHEELAPYYSHTGRPSIDPVLMIRMLLVGYVFAIRSERGGGSNRRAKLRPLQNLVQVWPHLRFFRLPTSRPFHRPTWP
jgi:hypothetical protein